MKDLIEMLDKAQKLDEAPECRSEGLDSNQAYNLSGDVFNALSDVMFRHESESISREDMEDAIELFMNHFFDGDASMNEGVGSRNSIRESSNYSDRARRLSRDALDDMIDMVTELAAENPDNKKYSDYLNSLKAEKAARNKEAQYDNSRRAKRDDLGLDRKYPYYITLYNEYPVYEPAEGGYYYAGLSAEEAEGFDSFQEAAAAIDEVAKELNSNDYNLVKKSATEYRDAGDKYVGTGAVLCVENNKQFRSRERGRVPYC